MKKCIFCKELIEKHKPDELCFAHNREQYEDPSQVNRQHPKAHLQNYPYGAVLINMLVQIERRNQETVDLLKELVEMHKKPDSCCSKKV